ncbi:MAG: Gfo/Idh/MocA family protein [Actinomycetota bacterium]
MTAPLRFGVVGAGVMGGHHLRNLREMDEAVVVGVVERDPSRARRMAAQGAPVVSELAELMERSPDAVVVAVPTSAHAEVAIPILRAGIACLVEKPLASTVTEAEAILAAAVSSGALLAVGHVERHNPAVRFLAGLIDQGEIGSVLSYGAVRTGPMPERIGDVGVVFDLVSHDLDIVRWLAGEDPREMRADIIRWTSGREQEPREAALHLVARFSSALATLDASWLHPTKTRRLHCLGTEGLVTVDYLQQEVTFARNDYEYRDWGPLVGLTGGSPGEQIRYRLQRKEPLRAELEAFVAAIGGRPDSVVSGADGLATVRLLARILSDVSSGREGSTGTGLSALSRDGQAPTASPSAAP